MSSVSKLLVKNLVTVLLNAPYSPDLLLSKFFIFLQCKQALRGSCYTDIEAIKMVITVQLHTIAESTFRGIFRNSGIDLSVQGRDYFKGYVQQLCVSILY
jgi:hypothetical protein